MIAIVLIIFTKESSFSNLIMLPALVLTVWSGLYYFKKSKDYFDY